MIDLLYDRLDQVREAQYDLFTDLGQTRQQREELARCLAHQCFRDQWVTADADTLQTILLAWIRQVPRDHLKRKLEEISHAPSPVSPVQAANRTSDQGTTRQRVRTRRDPRRTDRCESRSVSADDLPL